MKYLITVGTTLFDSLIREVETTANSPEFFEDTFVFQVGKGGHMPADHNAFEFTDDFNKYADSADVIITHAGAGSTYSFLEHKRKLIVVPNLERKDTHQIDLARFIEKNGYASVAYDVKDVMRSMRAMKSARFEAYTKTDFFMAEKILAFVTK